MALCDARRDTGRERRDTRVLPVSAIWLAWGLRRVSKPGVRGDKVDKRRVLAAALAIHLDKVVQEDGEVAAVVSCPLVRPLRHCQGKVQRLYVER